MEKVIINPEELVQKLFSLVELSDTQRDILCKRFGLDGEGIKTLEEIGLSYKVTREAVRQLEEKTLNYISKLTRFADFLKPIGVSVLSVLQKNGGVLAKEYLLESILSDQAQDKIAPVNLFFLLRYGAVEGVVFEDREDGYRPCWRHKKTHWNKVEQTVKEAEIVLKNIGQPLPEA